MSKSLIQPRCRIVLFFFSLMVSLTHSLPSISQYTIQISESDDDVEDDGSENCISNDLDFI